VLGYADYLGALERCRLEDPHNPSIFRTANWVLDYPFADRLYPHALDVVQYVRRWGSAVILSDGDAIFQPHKIVRSGLWHAFDGKVLIYIHKETELADVQRWHPARRYVLVDDKAAILAAVKAAWGDRVTTVFPSRAITLISSRPAMAPLSILRSTRLAIYWASICQSLHDDLQRDLCHGITPLSLIRRARFPVAGSGQVYASPLANRNGPRLKARAGKDRRWTISGASRARYRA
jgi:hypothetical protein